MSVIRSYFALLSSSLLLKCPNFFGKTEIWLIHFYLGAFGRQGEGQSQKGEDRSQAMWPYGEHKKPSSWLEGDTRGNRLCRQPEVEI